MNTIKAIPVLISTDKSFLFLYNGKLYDNRTTMHIPDGKQIPQELILINPNREEVKEGDFIVASGGQGESNQLIRLGKPNKKGQYFIIMGWVNNPISGKVVAKQDQLSPEYIQQFIEEYNVGDITNVEIDIEYHNKPMSDLFLIKKPKLTKNGFVTILKKIETKSIYSSWWTSYPAKSRYEMLRHCYPDFTGVVTEEMIKNIYNVFGAKKIINEEQKTELQIKFEEQTPSIKGIRGKEYLQVFITWLHYQIENKLYTEEEVIKYSYWLRTTNFNVEGHSPKDCLKEWCEQNKKKLC